MSSATSSTAAKHAQHQALVDAFEEFYRERYKQNIGSFAEGYPKDTRSLYIDYGDLFTYNQELAEDWLRHPSEIKTAAEEALKQYDLPIDITRNTVHVRLTDTGDLIPRHSVAGLAASDIGSYVAVRGQLDKVTGTVYRILEAVFTCQRCGAETTVPQVTIGEFQDPYQCESCERQGPFKINEERSRFVDLRKLKLSEPPEERSRGRGESVTVFVQDDLCWKGGANGLPDRSGEIVTVFGRFILNEKSGAGGRNADGEFDGWIRGRAIEFETGSNTVDYAEHLEEIKAVAERDDTIEALRDSIAPGLDPDPDLEVALEGAVAWLFGAYRIERDGGGPTRGDIHMAWIGDPGQGKSHTAGRLAHLSPKCEHRSGTGLKKVGLTAAADQQEFAGKTEWVLVPGILPRANGGHCIIDEVDAVVDEKTKAMHDALEGEQMVKVDKAGITANLPSRTGLLALGNPIHTRFDKFGDIAEQVDLDEALIDRMDLLFALTDLVDEERDRSKASHILENYDVESREEAHERGMDVELREEETQQQPVPDAVFRAMIAYARENVFPVMTPEARRVLEDFYIEVRNLNDGYEDGDDGGAIPATPRKLKAGIRLATAYARANLSETVEVEHAERAREVSKHVIGLNFDPMSGEFDDARTSRGQPKSQKELINRILDVVEQLDDDGEGAEKDAVVDRITNEGVKERRVRERIGSMYESGKLRYPVQGRVKTV